MTLQQLFADMTANPLPIVFYFLAIPIFAVVLNWVTKEESYESNWKYVYSTIVYLVCVPGIFSVVLCVYSMFITPQSLLNVNALVYFLPIVSMIATIMIITRGIPMAAVPGFDKLSGLVMLLAATSILVMLISKMRIFTVFFGSIWHLAGLFLILFVVIRLAWVRLMRSSDRAGIS